jgi:hypothetical protein
MVRINKNVLKEVQNNNDLHGTKMRRDPSELTIF